MPNNKVEYILLDVEGTTTSIHFVHDVLFPYAEKKLAGFLSDFADYANVGIIINALKERLITSGKDASMSDVVNLLKLWILEDRKEPLLKELQGLIWQRGYEAGEIRGHVYDDVPRGFKNWTERGLKIGIYSSGSVLAQRLIFGYSEHGDLNGYIQNNFDTAVGGKRESSSYKNIAQSLRLVPQSILFLSDIPQELEAAQTAGFSVGQLVRDETLGDTHFKRWSNFDQVPFPYVP